MTKLLPVVAAMATILTSCALPPDIPAESSAPTTAKDRAYATTAEVLKAVADAQTLQAVPPSLAATLTKDDQIIKPRVFNCTDVDNPADAELYGQCKYGDPNGKKLMAIYGDSGADMFAATLEGVAKANGWKLVVYAKHACPAPDLEFLSTQTKTPNEQCSQFHATAPQALMAQKPDLIIVTSFIDWPLADGTNPTAQQWQSGLTATLNKFNGAKLVVLSDVPTWKDDDSRCLAAHVNDVQACSAPLAEHQNENLAAEKAAADAVGALYVQTSPWVCAEKCEPIIADTRVYNDETHLTQSYAEYLTGAMGEALQPVLN